MDQDETWHAGRPWPRPHCLRWGSSSPAPKGAQPPFSVHVRCGQTAGWIKIPLGAEVGLSRGDFVLDGDPAPLPKKGVEPPIFSPFLLWPNGWMNQDATWYGRRPRPRLHCARWGPSLPRKKWAQPHQLLAHVCCGQTAVCIRIPFGTEVSLSLGDIVLDGTQRPSLKGHTPNFRPMSIVAKRLDGLRCHMV